MSYIEHIVHVKYSKAIPGSVLVTSLIKNYRADLINIQGLIFQIYKEII